MEKKTKVVRANASKPKMIKAKPVRKIQTAEGLKRSMAKKRETEKKMPKK